MAPCTLMWQARHKKGRDEMRTKEELKIAFCAAYHKSNLHVMASGIRALLASEEFVSLQGNTHWQYLVYQMERLIRDYDYNQELPGMVYGMIREAFQCLMEDYK
jgi:hypothetical protein